MNTDIDSIYRSKENTAHEVNRTRISAIKDFKKYPYGKGENENLQQQYFIRVHLQGSISTCVAEILRSVIDDPSLCGCPLSRH